MFNREYFYIYIFVVTYVTSKYTNFKVVLHMAHALKPVQLHKYCTADLVQTYSIRIKYRAYTSIYAVSGREFMFFKQGKAID